MLFRSGVHQGVVYENNGRRPDNPAAAVLSFVGNNANQNTRFGRSRHREFFGNQFYNSLRLEAGLCLYGQDLDTTTSPVEAGLTWAIQKSRRSGGERAGGFPGAERVLRELTQGPTRCRVGLVAQERVPVREHTPLQTQDGASAGEVCSGLLGPTCNQPIAMAYVLSDSRQRPRQRGRRRRSLGRSRYTLR